jgi:hypothetical protein
MHYITISVNQSNMFRSLMGSSSRIRIKVSLHKTELTIMYILKNIKFIKDDQLNCRRFRSVCYVLEIVCLRADGWHATVSSISSHTYIVGNVVCNLTFIRIPDDGSMRDRNMLDWFTDIVIQNIWKYLSLFSWAECCVIWLATHGMNKIKKKYI